MNMAVNTGLLNSEDNALLEELFAETDIALIGEIIETVDDEDEVLQADAAEVIEVNELMLEAAVTGAEKAEVLMTAYAEQADNVEASDMDLEAANAPVKAVKPKAVRAARDPSDLTVQGKLLKKTGGDAGMFILEAADVDMSKDQLEAHAKAMIDGAASLPVKVGNKMQLLFGYLKNGGRLNEYLLRAFEMLKRDGEITTGDGGNYIQAMTNPTDGRKAFTKGTARSQISQLGVLLPYLKVATKEPGKFVLNEDSVIFAAVSASIV